jgi:hypothetical protein
MLVFDQKFNEILRKNVAAKNLTKSLLNFLNWQFLFTAVAVAAKSD